MQVRERFAPSPTGPLHLGHAYSAITAWRAANSEGGQFLLRIEDIDQTRARPAWESQIYEDLAWLGLDWEKPVMRQSDRLPVYRRALSKLWEQGLLYSCHCNRRDIVAAVQAPQEGAELVYGPDGLIYPGTCAQQENFGHPSKPLPDNTTLRLSLGRTLPLLPDVMTFQEIGGQCDLSKASLTHTQARTELGDIVLSRKDFATSYHLSVVLDDAAQEITHVTRGADLLDATKIHIILQHLLNLPKPIYRHHKLIRDDAGKRLAKRDDAKAIAKFRNEGATPKDLFDLLGLDHRLT